METWGIVVLVIAIVFVLYFSAVLILTYELNKKVFGYHCMDPDNPCYLRPEDFPDMERKPYSVTAEKVTIRGYFYKDKGNAGEKGFIVLSHGMFGTHLQYIADIAYLTKSGYEVLAYDQYGCGESDGDHQVSLSQGIYTLDLVLTDVKEKGYASSRPLIVYGHSWGAYSGLGALKNHPEVKKAVLRSGPVDPITASLTLLKSKYLALYIFLVPLYRWSNHLIFGKRNCVNAAKRARDNTTTKILVLRADDDTMVSKKNSIVTYYEKHPKKQVETFVTEKGLHNSIITEESYQKFMAKAKEYYEINSLPEGDEKTRRMEAYMGSLDRVSYLEYNEPVKEKILTFLAED